jgi:hypothetical protein
MAAADEPAWFVLDECGAQCGPLASVQVAALLAAGELADTTLCWRHGMSGWTHLEHARTALPPTHSLPTRADSVARLALGGRGVSPHSPRRHTVGAPPLPSQRSEGGGGGGGAAAAAGPSSLLGELSSSLGNAAATALLLPIRQLQRFAGWEDGALTPPLAEPALGDAGALAATPADSAATSHAAARGSPAPKLLLLDELMGRLRVLAPAESVPPPPPPPPPLLFPACLPWPLRAAGSEWASAPATPCGHATAAAATSPPLRLCFGRPLSPTRRTFRALAAHLDHAHILRTEGLFRVSAEHARVRALRARLDGGESVCAICDEMNARGGEAHVAAALLKALLRELPEPPCTRALYPAFVAAGAVHAEAGGDRVDGGAAAARPLRALARLLPAAHRALLGETCALLGRVAAEEPSNRMSARALANVFAPNLLRPDSVALALRDLGCTTGATFALIARGGEIFAADEEEWAAAEEVCYTGGEGHALAKTPPPPPPRPAAAGGAAKAGGAADALEPPTPPTPPPVPTLPAAGGADHLRLQGLDGRPLQL